MSSREKYAHLVAARRRVHRQRACRPADAKLAARARVRRRRSGRGTSARCAHRSAGWPICRGTRPTRFARCERTSALRSPPSSTLSIGIGATTAIYSVVDTVLIRPLPFAGGDRIVAITEPERPTDSCRASTYQEFLEWRSRTTTLEAWPRTLSPQVIMATRERHRRASRPRRDLVELFRGDGRQWRRPAASCAIGRRPDPSWS